MAGLLDFSVIKPVGRPSGVLQQTQQTGGGVGEAVQAGLAGFAAGSAIKARLFGNKAAAKQAEVAERKMDREERRDIQSERRFQEVQAIVAPIARDDSLTSQQKMDKIGSAIFAADPKAGKEFFQASTDMKKAAVDELKKTGDLKLAQEVFNFERELKLKKDARDARLDELKVEQGKLNLKLSGRSADRLDRELDFKFAKLKSEERMLQLRNAEARADKAFDKSKSLRDSFRNDSKGHNNIAAAFRRLQAVSADPSPAGDLAMIFSFMKINDPDSVVRESEFATAEATGSIPQRFVAMRNKVLSGKRLSQEQRDDFVRKATSLFKASDAGHMKTVEEYGRLATSFGLSPEQVIIDTKKGLTDDDIVGIAETTKETPTTADAITEQRARFKEKGVDIEALSAIPADQLSTFAADAVKRGAKKEDIAEILDAIRRSK